MASTGSLWPPRRSSSAGTGPTARAGAQLLSLTAAGMGVCIQRKALDTQHHDSKLAPQHS